MMKKWRALAVVGLMAVAGNAFAQNAAYSGKEWNWEPVSWITSVANGSANPTLRDSTMFTWTNTLGHNAGGAETTSVFGPWSKGWVRGPADSSYSLVATGAAAPAVVYNNGDSQLAGDSTFAFVFLVHKKPGSGITETGDSVSVILQGSWDGEDWVTIKTEQPIVELATDTNTWLLNFHTSLHPTDIAGGAANLTLFPTLRFIVQNDRTTANVGEYMGKVGYWTNGPPADRSRGR